jgi:glycogen operon protein
VLSRVKLIAEPWDTGPDGYQLGNFPPGWAEWNDQYRDGVRSYWKGDSGVLPGLSARLLGSSDMFERRGRRSWSSVNFVTAHDGFTLTDTVSYNDKHNEANLEDNRDGHSHNYSWNCGVEGTTDDEDVLDLRDQLRRAMIATLLVSQGTPMLLMGDEVGRSQGGNNNAYCQDNAMNWLQLEGLGPRDAAFLEFVRNLVAMRRDGALFRQDRFLHGAPTGPDAVEVHWLRPDGHQMQDGDWHDPRARTLGMLLRDRTRQAVLLFNSHFDPVLFTLPSELGEDWEVRLNTVTGEIGPGTGVISASAPVAAPPRGLLLLEAPR